MTVAEGRVEGLHRMVSVVQAGIDASKIVVKQRIGRILGDTIFEDMPRLGKVSGHAVRHSQVVDEKTPE